jgi:hypothetical protein
VRQLLEIGQLADQADDGGTSRGSAARSLKWIIGGPFCGIVHVRPVSRVDSPPAPPTYSARP